MKTTTRFAGAILTLVMLFALGTGVSAAADSMSNFSRTRTYSGQYADVRSDHWAYGSIRTCFETSLMQGSDGKFSPENDLTVAEALVMADRVHQIYHTGVNSLTNGSPWYQTYVDYAIANGIISSGDFGDYTAKISRADMAYIFSRALPSKELAQLNNIGEIPDLNQAPSRDRNPILLLYYAGVLTGSDAYGTFNPNNNIKRQEAAAIIARVAIPAERRQVTLLYKVERGIVTLGLPQTGFLKQESDENGETIRVEGSAIVASIGKQTMEGAGDADLTTLITAERTKELWEQNVKNAAVTKASFGSINSYRITGYYDYPQQKVYLVAYQFICGDTMYTVAVNWGESADSSEVLRTVQNVLVKGSSASPAWNG